MNPPRSLWLTTLVGLLVTPALACAALTMPRGPGFYFHPAKVLAVLALYLLWARVCLWVHEDCEEVGLPAKVWNCVITFTGLLALLFAFTLPFHYGFPLAVLLFLTALFVYVHTRNGEVKPADKVLTLRHISALLGGLLSFGKRPRGEKKAREAPLGLRFVGRDSASDKADKQRRRDAEESEEYQAALDLIRDALEQKATDIHMEPTRDEMTVRFRVDGILQAVAPYSRERGDSVLNIYKVLAALDITEKRKPQDGSFSAELVEPLETGGTRTRLIDFRVSSTGSLAGEKLVLRILDKVLQTADLGKLGMRDKLAEQIRRLVGEPHGMFIVCGPTGAGKSTTLYACLAQLDRFQKNVITLENPVEYRIDHATQIEINPKAGKTFAGELRSILRQDPDVIYIGEVRDQETAEIGCQAAQTGHLVLTTLHANDTVGALARLMDLKVPVYMIASAVSGILSQRLVRVLCPKCRIAYRPSADVLRKMGLGADKVKLLYKAKEHKEGAAEEDEDGPCEHCKGRGYKGRVGVYELLVLTDKMRALLKQSPPDLEGVRQEALRTGMKYLLEDGFRQVVEGKTSIQELLRVCA